MQSSITFAWKLICVSLICGLTIVCLTSPAFAQETPPSDTPPANDEAEVQPATEPVQEPEQTQKPEETFEDEMVLPSGQDENDPESGDQEGDEALQPGQIPKGLELTASGNIRFNFEGMEWKPVINWFADQCGFSLQPTDDYPEGTFTYHDDAEYTVMEGLDQINHALSLRGYTLVRNRKMLVLRSNRQPPPDEMIETVTPELLNERGKYEIMRCVYDLAGLEDIDVDNEVERIVSTRNRDSVVYVPSAKKLFVRDMGEHLRTIRDMLAEIRRLKLEASMELRTYELQNVPVEELLVIARPLIGMSQDSNSMEDGSLTIQAEPLGNKLYLKGSAKKINEFLKVAELVDVPAEPRGNESLERPSLKTYEVRTEPTLVFQILQTLLEGRDVKLDQDAVTGSIILWGRPDDHSLVEATIMEVSQNANDFKIFVLAHALPIDVVSYLQTMFRQDPDEPSTSGPIFIVDSENDRLIVKASPMEIKFITQMIAELDVPARSNSGGIRTQQRVIPMSTSEADRILSGIEDLWPTVGRQNRINVVWPNQRSQMRRSLPTYPDLNELRLPKEDENQPSDSNQSPEKGGEQSDSSNKSGYWKTAPVDLQYVSAPNPFQEQETDETDKRSVGDTSQDYVPPEQQPSIPNAPLTFKMTPMGLVVSSEDLDALDDAVKLIEELLSLESTAQLPQVFLLKYRKANEAKTLLEMMLGIESSSGGGGLGGIPGMIGNMAANAIGGSGGDLLSGLLGGDSGSTSSEGLTLEGTVTIVEDIKLNSLIVSGATDADLELIAELIDYIDQPEAPHAPDILGPTWIIPVVYRDPEELKTLIEKQFAELLTGGGSAGGGDPNAQAAAQQAQMLQQMQRAFQNLGRGGGGQTTDPEELRPKAVLGIDTENNYLLVTGPKFIYEQIFDLVQQLDKKELREDKTPVIVQGGPVNAKSVAQMLKGMFPDKIEIVESEPATGEPNRTNPQGGGQQGGNQMSQQQQQMAERFREAMMNQLQNQRGNRGGGGGGNRGGGGGGNRGGGDRGGGGNRGGFQLQFPGGGG